MYLSGLIFYIILPNNMWISKLAIISYILAFHYSLITKRWKLYTHITIIFGLIFFADLLIHFYIQNLNGDQNVEKEDIDKKIENLTLELKGRRRIIQAVQDEIEAYRKELVKLTNEYNKLENDIFLLNIEKTKGEKGK